MERLRTFGIVAHIDAGKTTLTERILHDAGAQPHVGSVDDGTATMDWLPAERSRGISITAAATRVQWGGCTLQVVDTPGHVDFVAEVERCLHVLDGVVVLVDGVRGVESQTVAVWRQAAARSLPRIVFVNKLDRDGADFDACVAELRQRLECEPLPVVVPFRDGDRRFAGLGDALSGAVQWFDGRPDAADVQRLQAELRAAHERIVDAAADADEAILADALAGRRIAPERLRVALRPRVLAGTLVPVLAGAALWNRGVDWLLDGVVHWLPSPAETPRAGLWGLTAAGDPQAAFCGLVFKVQHADEVWNFVRVVRGELRPGMAWVRARQPGEPMAAPELWTMRADRHEGVAAAGPGEIVVLPGEFGLRTGDTLCAPAAVEALPPPRFPAPVLTVSFEPEDGRDLARLTQALRELAADDPTLRVDRDGDRLRVRGMGELHLDVVADAVRARTGARFHASRPQVDRRETIAVAATGSQEVRAMIGGRERAARCVVDVAPAGDEAPAAVAATGGDGAAVAPAMDELRALVATGSVYGPLHGCRVALRDAVGDGSGVLEPLVQQAAAKALAQALDRAQVVALEPYVSFEVRCPEDAMTPVVADLGSRGAQVAVVAAGRLGGRVEGRAPLARMLGYVTKLRSMTRGLGQVDLRPVGYARR
jgi:elongation factor G